MKQIAMKGLILVVLYGSMLVSGDAFAQDLVLAKKTLTRTEDPVIMEGRLIHELIGAPISNIRLYAYKDGAFKPVRYQIDEMTGEGGDWIMTGGPIKSIDLSNKRLDTWDILLFMAVDTGDRVKKEAWTPGYTKGSEIEVIDPLTGEKGWCYVLYFASNPPARSSEPDYLSYDYATATFLGENVGAKYIITDEGLHTAFYESQWVTKAAGGNGLNYADRLKVRTTIKVLGFIPIRLNEEQVKSNTIALHTGPVRAIKRVEQYVKVLNIPALRVVEDVIYYRWGATVPVQFQIPVNKLRRFGVSLVIRFGTDYSPNVLDSMCYSSTNPQGFEVDGRMDDGEENYNSAFDDWRLITGEFGTFMSRTILTDEIKDNVKITMGLIDDLGHIYPPETYPGSIGYVWQDWDFSDAAKGKYHLYVEFYHPDHYKLGDEVQFLNYMDHPLRIKVGYQEGLSQLHIRPEYEKRYQKHYEPKDLEKYTKDM